MKAAWRIAGAAAVFLLGAPLMEVPAFGAPPVAEQRPQPGRELLQKIEAKLGRPLTPEQRQKYLAAAKDSVDNLKARQQQFAGQVAQISGLSADQIKEMLPAIVQPGDGAAKNIIPKLEEALGKKLVPGQLAQLRKADGEKRAGMQAIQDAFAKKVTDITGLKLEDIKALLPKAAA